MDVTVKIKLIQVLTNQAGTDRISLQLDAPTPYPEMGYDAHLDCEARRGFGTTWVQMMFPEAVAKGLVEVIDTKTGKSSTLELVPRDVKIKINGRERTVPSKFYSYEEIVHLACEGKAENLLYSIMYRSHVRHFEGILGLKDSVFVDDGLIFNVAFTGGA